MPENIIKFNVFVASTNDVAEEKQAIKEVITEINKYYSDFKYILEYSDWEDCTPGMGRSQADIDKLIANCDIFICLMWKRYGRIISVDNPISYTENEFRYAYELFKEKKTPHILIYFKNIVDPISTDDIQNIIRFKNYIKEKNMGIFSEFNSDADISIKVSSHLKQIMVEKIQNSLKSDEKNIELNNISQPQVHNTEYKNDININVRSRNGGVEVITNHLFNQPYVLKLYSDPSTILSGGDATNLIAQVYKDGTPYRQAGVLINFYVDNPLMASLPNINSNSTNNSGMADIPLFSNDKLGFVKVTAVTNIGNQLVSDTIQVNIVGWGNICGIVLDSNGTGVPNATVKLWKYELNPTTNDYEIITLVRSPENPRYTVSRPEIASVGSFLYKRIPWGKYCITAEKANSLGEVKSFFAIANLEKGTITCNIVITGYVNPMIQVK